MRKSIVRAMAMPDISPGDFADLVSKSLGAKDYPTEIIKDIIPWGLAKLEQKQADEPIPCLTAN